jgi:signal transduction histidine kinase
MSGHDLADAAVQMSEAAAFEAAVEARVAARTRRLRRRVARLHSYGRSVSHDLRNPLSCARGFLELLKFDHHGALTMDARRLLDMLENSLEDLRQTMDDLELMSEVAGSKSRSARIDLVPIVADVNAALRRTHTTVRVQTTVPASIAVWADARLVRLVLQQLLANAWKFSARAEQPLVTIEHRRTPQGDIVSVIDNGVGFEASAARELFMPFRRLHANFDFGGRGAGLALAARAADRLGGWVWADTESSGACFRLFLPLRPADASPRADLD